MPRKGQENLIPTNERTKEEARALGAKGGVKSGITRRKKKATNELIRAALALKPQSTDATLAALKRMGYDVDVEGLPTVETLFLLNLLQEGLNGNIGAIRLLYEYGHVPDMKTQLERERIKATQNINITAGGFDALDAAFGALKNDEPAG